MISERSRAMLDKYALASRALSRQSGERIATEAGQSVEFHDFRPYQPGDELRYVDWRVYGRTGKLFTRLFQAERNIAVYILLDTSPSMALGGKADYSRTLAELLAYAAHRDAVSQIHLFDGSHSPLARGRAHVPAAWSFIDAAPVLEGAGHTPSSAIQHFALSAGHRSGPGLALIISDLFDANSLQTALAALRYRSFDASFLQVMSAGDLEPESSQLEIVDAESGDRLIVGPAEVRAYREAVGRFVTRTRTTILQAGFRHLLLKVDAQAKPAVEQGAFAALLRAGILVKR